MSYQPKHNPRRNSSKKSTTFTTAIPLPVTTRQFGFATTTFLSLVNSLAKVEEVQQRYESNCGLPAQYYRVALALFEARMATPPFATMDGWNDKYHFEFESLAMKDSAKFVTTFPEPLADIINAIGVVTLSDRSYMPYMPPNREEDGKFIPQPEHITLSNLRNTVVSLSQIETSEEVRQNFYNSSPIPAAMWEKGPNGPILTNPDEIMPDDYNHNMFYQDLQNVQGHFYYVTRKYPQYQGRIDWDRPKGNKDLLVCTEMSNMRVSDRNPNETLFDYTRRALVENECSDHYKNMYELTEAEQIRGVANLLGEIPSLFSGKYYDCRTLRFLPFGSSMMNYHSCYHLRHGMF